VQHSPEGGRSEDADATVGQRQVSLGLELAQDGACRGPRGVGHRGDLFVNDVDLYSDSALMRETRRPVLGTSIQINRPTPSLLLMAGATLCVSAKAGVQIDDYFRDLHQTWRFIDLIVAVQSQAEQTGQATSATPVGI
jgi:hypothetical protein